MQKRAVLTHSVSGQAAGKKHSWMERESRTTTLPPNKTGGYEKLREAILSDVSGQLAAQRTGRAGQVRASWRPYGPALHARRAHARWAPACPEDETRGCRSISCC